VAKTLKRIDAGGLRVEALYSRCSPHDSPAQRQAKHQASSAAQRRMNQIYSWQKLELMLAANFPSAGSGLVVTLTHDDKHMPKDRKEAQMRFRYFLFKLRRERRTAGLPDPVVFWAPEILTSDTGRWHHHIVLDNTGRDLDMIRRCWIYGTEIEAEKLRVDDEKNYETLARYMTKEIRECQEYSSRPGLHGWSYTRNAKRPEIETFTVPDDYDLTAPDGSTVLLDERRATEWSSYRVLKYRFSVHGSAHRIRAKRRRRKHTS